MSDPVELRGATVLVTGASTGVGFATVQRMLQEGATVIGTVRKEEDAAKVRETGATAEILDVTDTDAGRALVARVAPDVLVNNAAYSYRAAFEHGDLDAIRQMFEVNFFGAVALAQAAIPAMRERRRGVIANVTSISGRIAQHLNGYYPATKFALEAVSEQMHYELRPFGIRVVIIEPGGIHTNFIPNMRVEPRTYDDPDNPYAPLAAKMRPSAPSGSDPSVVADTIVRAVEADAPGRLRWPATPDATEILTARDRMNDAQWETWWVGRNKIEW